MSSTLADRVYAILSDQNSDELFRIAWESCEGDEARLDAVSWGLCVGLAHGIARGEDAYESTHRVTMRSEVAAREAHDRWASNADTTVTA